MAMLNFSRYANLSCPFTISVRILETERKEGERCEYQSHVEADKCPRPTPLSGASLRAAFVKCWQTAQHRENKRRSTISHPRFNYLIESDGTPAVRSPVVFCTFSLARFPHNDSTLQMRVTSDKSFRTSGEASLPFSLALSMCRPITVKDPHLLCSRARATGPTNEGNQALRALLTRVSAAPQLQRTPRYTRASLRGRYVSSLVPMLVSWQSRGCYRHRTISGSSVSTESKNLK